MNPARRCLSMVKGEHRYVFRYVEGCEAELLSSFVMLANDSDCEFDWFDAAVLSYRMGQQLSHYECEAVLPLEQG
jgi:hypothetical protein